MTQRTISYSKLVLLCLLLCLGRATKLASQQPGPSDPGAAQQLPSAPEAQNTSTLTVSVRRVVVDVVVTDAHGKPVKGLPASQFHVFEDGKPQSLRSFDEHTSESLPPPPKPDLPPNTFSNLSSAPATGPVTVILYDLLNTPIDSQPFARAQLLQFLKQRSVSSQTAIFVLSDKLHLLQGFTDDENQLIAALNSQNAGPYRSGNLQANGEASQQSDSLARTAGNQTAADADQSASFQELSTMLKHMESIDSSYLIDRRVEITANALEDIARFLVALPGRKNLLWLSGSFPSGILPDASLAGRDSFDVTRNYSTTLVQATDLLNLGHIAVYPVDVRGLQTQPMFSAAGNQTFEPGSGKDTAALRTFNQQQTSEHSTMDVMAEQTGGRAFYNTNGLKEAVATAVDDGSAYYTLTYAPTDAKLDGGARHIRVELGTPGYHLAYRRTYFADNIDSNVAAAAALPNDPLAATLQHGSPVAHELFFEAHLATFGAPTPATPEQMEVLAKYAAINNPKQKSASPAGPPQLMQRYVIEYGLLLRQLDLTTTPDGAHHANLDFAVVSFDPDGNTLNGIRSQVQDSIPPARYERLHGGGYEVVQTVAVPARAAYLRLAVRDVATGHMGSLELRLPLAATPPAAGAPAPATVPKPTIPTEQRPPA
jgi:VWFA-related protein